MIPFNKSPLRIVDNIPRFIELDSDYTGNFGFQWNKFRKTQIDTSSNIQFSKTRVQKSTNWSFEKLCGVDILEAGSGAGRFTDILNRYSEANIYSFDYSNAVKANWENNNNDRIQIFQASIYDIPFDPQKFDKVICFGVLQHTPDFKLSVECLANMVKPGGELVIDFYPIKGWWTKICAKYILRPFIKKMPNEKLLKIIDANIDWMISASKFFNKIGLNVLNRFIPICDIKNTLPHNISDQELREWCVLDTFDMFSPAYDHPQRIGTVKNWVESSGLVVEFAGFIEYESISSPIIRASRPIAN